MKKIIALPMLLLGSIYILHAKHCTPCTVTHTEEPQLTIAIVIDQGAYRHIDKLQSYLRYGLKFFINQSIFYKEAYVPYAWPETAPGHTSLSTGTVPAEHGIITNSWLTKSGKEIECDADTAERAGVFGLIGTQHIGRSPHNIMVDSISDQLMLQTQQHKNYKVFSISGKSRAAIGTANKLGKAIWLDDNTCMFTSSKAYFDTLPTWISRFNERKKIKSIKYTWHLANPCPGAYKFKNTHNYRGSKYTYSLIGKTFSLCDQRKEFMLTPQANQLVFDAALACLDEHFSKENPDEKLFLWVLPSSLDKVGHNFGPESIEAIDTIYHLDRQIKRFMDCVNRKTHKRNVLWIITADHGMTLLPEQVKEKGYTSARRIMGPEVVANLNAHLAKEFNVDNLVLLFNANNIYVNEERYEALEKPLKKKISKEIKKYIGKLDGIRKVWTIKEMATLPTHKGSILDNFKNQIFKGRSGKFIVQSYPFVYVSQKPEGLSHQSPYTYDTHIPIMIYQRGKLQNKIVYDRVYNIQLAPTIAHLLGVPRPSACTAEILPGIIYKSDPCF
jgi:predicted AlkP superfamily pyrophosphatase or phosphodiesterase